MYRLAIPILSVALVGCASIDTTRQASSEQDTAQTYAAPFPQVVRATRESLPELGLYIRQDEPAGRAAHVLIAERVPHGDSFGELVRVTLRDTGHGVEARVFTEPRFLTNFTADWDLSPVLFTQIDEELQRDNKAIEGGLASAALLGSNSGHP